MKPHEFTIVATATPLDIETWQDRLFEAGCDDAVVSLERGLLVLHFDREAETARDAVASACMAVATAGATVCRIEPDPLAGMSDIAERASLTRQAVSLYAGGERGRDFPRPAACVSTGRPLWAWPEVARWLRGKDLVTDEVLELADAIASANDGLTEIRAAWPAMPVAAPVRPKPPALEAIFGMARANGAPTGGRPTWIADLGKESLAIGRSFALHPRFQAAVH